MDTNGYCVSLQNEGVSSISGWVVTSRTVLMCTLQVSVSSSPLCSFASSDQPRISPQAMKSKAIMPDVAHEKNPPSLIISCLERLGCICIMDAADLSFQYISFVTVLQSLLVGHPESGSLSITQMSFHLFCSLLMGMRTNALKDFTSSGTWHILWTLSRARHKSSSPYHLLLWY